MLGALKNMRFASKKRGSEALEEDPVEGSSKSAVASTASPHIASLLLTESPGSPPRRKKSPSKPRSRASISQPAPPPEPDTPEVALKKLIRACPPRAFHSELLTRLDAAKPEQVSALAELLEGLAPPPVLHCARCHQDFLEEDNYERSCVMDHDDNSTEVKHGETTWGCCGNTVDGEDTPLGWCYEGKHTDDRVKARYREDFEGDGPDDGLQSCKQTKCKPRVGSANGGEVHVVVTRHRGERLPPAKKKRVV